MVLEGKDALGSGGECCASGGNAGSGAGQDGQRAVSAAGPRPQTRAGGGSDEGVLFSSVELLGIRIAVPPGFDRATFSAVLDEIETRRARGGGR